MFCYYEDRLLDYGRRKEILHNLNKSILHKVKREVFGVRQLNIYLMLSE